MKLLELILSFFSVFSLSAAEPTFGCPDARVKTFLFLDFARTRRDIVKRLGDDGAGSMHETKTIDHIKYIKCSGAQDLELLFADLDMRAELGESGESVLARAIKGELSKSGVNLSLVISFPYRFLTRASSDQLLSLFTFLYSACDIVFNDTCDDQNKRGVMMLINDWPEEQIMQLDAFKRHLSGFAIRRKVPTQVVSMIRYFTTGESCVRGLLAQKGVRGSARKASKVLLGDKSLLASMYGLKSYVWHEPVDIKAKRASEAGPAQVSGPGDLKTVGCIRITSCNLSLQPEQYSLFDDSTDFKQILDFLKCGREIEFFNVKLYFNQKFRKQINVKFQKSDKGSISYEIRS